MKYLPWLNDVVKLNGDAVVTVVLNGFAPNDVPNPPNEGAIQIVLKTIKQL